nr:K195 [uncultured bacterium]
MSIRFVIDETLAVAPAASSGDRLVHAGRLVPILHHQPDDLDKDKASFAEVKNAALALANMVKPIRTGKYRAPDEKLRDPREI